MPDFENFSHLCIESKERNSEVSRSLFRLVWCSTPCIGEDVKTVAEKKKLSTMLFISMKMINGPQIGFEDGETESFPG